MHKSYPWSGDKKKYPLKKKTLRPLSRAKKQDICAHSGALDFYKHYQVIDNVNQSINLD